MGIRAIVFDFGMVLGTFDRNRTTSRLASHTMLPRDVLHAALFDPRLEDEYESGKWTTEQMAAIVRARAKLTCSLEFLMEACGDIFEPNSQLCALVPRLRPGYRLVLGSNTNELHARYFRRQFAATLAHFDGLVLSYEVGTRKPHARFFEECCRRADCAADECVFIDDLPGNVAGARAAGLHAIHYTGFEPLIEGLAELGVAGL